MAALITWIPLKFMTCQCSVICWKENSTSAPLSAHCTQGEHINIPAQDSDYSFIWNDQSILRLFSHTFIMWLKPCWTDYVNVIKIVIRVTIFTVKSRNGTALHDKGSCVF